jgi:Tellurite resistance protein TerB
MGLFDSFRKGGVQQRSQISLGPAEGFAAIMILVVSSDGHIAEEEVNLLSATFSRMQLFRSYPQDMMNRMITNIYNILRREGVDVLFGAAIATLPHELYETAFAMATDLVLADGHISKEEEGLLISLCRALDLPEKLVAQVVEVMLIKNRG